MNTFVDFLTKYRVPFDENGESSRRGWIAFECPFCGPGSGKLHMGYHKMRGAVNCFKCGRKALKDLVRLVSNLTPQQAEQFVRQLPKSKAPSNLDIQPTGRLELPKGIGDLEKPHRRYLKERGIDWREAAELWKVQGLGLSAMKLKWRLFIPFIYKGQTVSWTTRSISQTNEMRYVTAKREQEAISHKKLLYGSDFAIHTVIVVEGLFDVWKIGPGAVALFGTRYSRSQVQQLARYSVRYVCMDEGADTYSQRLVSDLLLYPGETYELKLDAKDPGSCSPKEIRQLRKLLK